MLARNSHRPHYEIGMESTLPSCVCTKPVDGTTFICPRYERMMFLRDWEFCSGDCPLSRPCPEYTRAIYVKKYSKGAVKIQPGKAIVGGPGTEIGELIVKLGVVETKDCQCRARIVQMDEWGVEGCKEKRAYIIDWLKEQQATLGWAKNAAITANAIVQGLWLNPLNPIGSLVDLAIKRAEEKAGQS